MDLSVRDHSQSTCGELLGMAERELTAFHVAVTKAFGAEQASRSAEYWMEEFVNAGCVPVSPRDWRQITVAAARRLAIRMEAAAA